MNCKSLPNMLYLIKNTKDKIVSQLNYSIITEIKKSDKGNVYLAKVEKYDFPVVVKELKHGNLKVFEALKEINNGHLPKIYHVEEGEDGLLIAEEYVEGELLADYIAANKLTEAGCLNIVKQLCEALQVLHNHEPALIHRDIKPSNIIVGKDGDVKLIDFDSSRLFKEEADTDTRFLGTEKYAPPEQYGFSQTDCRSDIYSLGVVFEKLTSFISKSNEGKWKRIVEKCTLFSPDSRFQKVEEVERELSKIGKNGYRGKIAAFVGLICVLVIAAIWIEGVGKQKEPIATGDETVEVIGDPIVGAIADTIAGNIEEVQTYIPDLDEVEEELPKENVVVIEDVLDEQYKTIAPEWRDLESDPEQYVSLKNMIRANQMVTVYCFKDRLKNQDFLLHVKELDYDGFQFSGMKIYDQITGAGVYIEDEYVKATEGVVVISNEYMNSLANGYYTLATIMGPEGEEPMEKGIYLNVAGSDVLEEPSMWLQNTTFEYGGGENESLHMVVKNDSSKKIASLQMDNGSEIDSSYYEILQDGRVLELSAEYLKQLNRWQFLNLKVVSEDGDNQVIAVTYK